MLVLTPIGESITPQMTWPTTDPDERVTVTLELSLNEFVALASAVDVGRDIAYGGASLNIWWVWIRSTNTMAFCDQVDDCIETNEATQTTINNVILQTGVVSPNSLQVLTPEMPNRFPQSERTENSSPPPPSCDKDALWTGILEIVERLDTQARDFLEIVVAKNDAAERIANIIDIVPLFGDVAADVITVFSDVTPDLLNAFNAHSTQQVLEETACNLFELVCNECRYPTYDEIYDEYASAGISGIEDIEAFGITGLIDFMIGSNNLANAVVWYTMNVGVLYTLYLGGNWGSYRGTKWLEIWADIGEDAPTNGWELLCDGCQDTIAIPATGNAFTGGGNIYSVNVNIGQTVTINYVDGIWDYGTGWSGDADGEAGETDPLAVMPAENLGRLVVREAGKVTWASVGVSQYQYTAIGTGLMYLTANDKDIGYSDNGGEVNVTIDYT